MFTSITAAFPEDPFYEFVSFQSLAKLLVAKSNVDKARPYRRSVKASFHSSLPRLVCRHERVRQLEDVEGFLYD